MIAKQGEILVHLSEVCDLWENLQAFWGVQIATEFHFGEQVFPRYCEMLYTVYDVQHAVPEIILQHSRVTNGLNEYLTVGDIYQDLCRIELTMSRRWEDCAALDSPARKLLIGYDLNSYSIMRGWWHEFGRAKHV